MPSSNSRTYSLGVDPGWKNCGISILRLDEAGLTLVFRDTVNPAALGGQVKAVEHILETIEKAISKDGGDLAQLSHVSIERYVSYNNVMTAESENIVMLIGGLIYALASLVQDIKLYRAIEWKTDLVKLLVKNKGFDNPSQSLDKKFSKAAARACLDLQGDFENDHEADAICIGAIGILKDRYAKRERKPT